MPSWWFVLVGTVVSLGVVFNLTLFAYRKGIEAGIRRVLRDSAEVTVRSLPGEQALELRLRIATNLIEQARFPYSLAVSLASEAQVKLCTAVTEHLNRKNPASVA